MFLHDEINYRFEEGKKFKWPKLIDKHSHNVDGRKILVKEAKSHDAIYIYNFKEGKYKIINKKSKLFFSMKGDKNIFDSVWFWQIFGGGSDYPDYGRSYLIAIEPWIGYPNYGEKAFKEKRTLKIKPHEGIETEIIVDVGKKMQ